MQQARCEFKASFYCALITFSSTYGLFVLRTEEYVSWWGSLINWCCWEIIYSLSWSRWTSGTRTVFVPNYCTFFIQDKYCHAEVGHKYCLQTLLRKEGRKDGWRMCKNWLIVLLIIKALQTRKETVWAGRWIWTGVVCQNC
jgi:hypothetical protein